ncbi:Excalibur calcium-binding domain protein [Marinomonas gallaica]|uniref:Excalibur calcium-binding domain protein n=1 Tax=Marinomonas gallaica TaxID=1806667 RepID=A0A1C3JVZ3_9GAMM|nr:excalibur calcium-binding domain-containing protein [Marinomonas gallaica]SBT19325.1 Excalibur calcium-binding domain protein [Marinomonas gallaica]SBT22851.1 Excalibur calcium-binding domain protein [Marinomonas gallaica]
MLSQLYPIFIIGASLFLYSEYQSSQTNKVATIVEPRHSVEFQYSESSRPRQIATSPIRVQHQPAFQCDGRQHCSQMRTRAEAEFFLASCPDTKMDGDHDGIPCEGYFL